MQEDRVKNNFDAIRILMALTVVWSHSFAIYLSTEDNEPISLLMNGTHNAGNLAVLVFFVISGYLICQSAFNSRSMLSFFDKRIRRIYPGYLVATTICAFIVVPLFSSHTDLSVWQIEKTFGLNLLLKNYVPPSDAFGGRGIVNGSLWSIPYEFWCYIGLASMTALFLRRAKWTAPLITALLILTRIWLDATGRKPGGGITEFIIGWQYIWFSVLPCFLAGTTLYLYRDSIQRNGFVALIGIAIMIVASHLPVDRKIQEIATNTLLPPVIAYATICLAFSSTIRWHNAAAFGDFSYGTYLYAYPIQLMMLACFPQLSFPLYTLACLTAALIAGIISWCLVERWFLIRKHQDAKLNPAGKLSFDVGSRSRLSK
jgi:peptidoglycan/LPS O-acetylase OafA/YrhL